MSRVGAATAGDRILAKSLRAVPRPVIERLARPYVAGTSLEDAAAITRTLEGRGRTVTYDVLAEEQHGIEESHALAREYETILDRIGRDRLPATLSVRMTALGLQREQNLCEALLGRVARRALELGIGITIDMEDSSTTSATLAAYERLRSDGLNNVGIVLQAYLRRTGRDVRTLAPLAPRVRVVKGVWVEPYSVAFRDPDIIRSNYLRIVERLLDAGSYLELATHDEWLLEEALELVRKAGLEPASYECQMLLGVRPDLGDVLVDEQHQVRVYVPYGPDWYPYCLRRLAESPQIARHVLADSVSRTLGR